MFIPKDKRRLGALLAGLTLFAAIVYALYRTVGKDFDRELFFRSFAQVNFGWMSLAVALVLLTYVGRAIRWKVMISPLRPKASLGGLIRATLIGFTAVTLFGRPGELVRPYLIARRESLGLSSQLAVWFFERVYDLMAVLVIFGYALTRVEAHPNTGEALTWVLQAGGYLVTGLGLICVALMVAITFFSDAASRRLQEGLAVVPLKYRERLQASVSSFASGLGSSQKREFVLQLVLLTALEWAIITAASFYLFRAFPLTSALSFTDTLVFLGFVAFGSIIQLPGIGGGMQVVAAAVLTQIFGLNLEGSAAIALLIWVTMYVSVIPLGLLFAVLEGVSWKSLRRLDERAETIL